MKYLFFSIFISSTASAAMSFHPDDLAEVTKIIASVGASCMSPSGLPTATEALGELTQGTAQVVTESALTLAFKKDYPTLCHILPPDIAQEIGTEREKVGSRCLSKLPGEGCALKEREYSNKYTYYWPKYFIESTVKENDSHPAFAKNNQLYGYSQKLGDSMKKHVDEQGPRTILDRVLGTSWALEQFAGVKISGQSTEALIQQKALEEFETLRVRNSQSSDMAHYSVNIWPVGLSKSIAEHLTVCGDGIPTTNEGGYSWKVPSVPMTCPIAQSKHAWAYWDTGLLDYLNTNALRGIVTSSTPQSCLAEYSLGQALDQLPERSTGNALGEGTKWVDSLSQRLPTNYQGILGCSFPLIGSSTAILSQYFQNPFEFGGPWCSPWGTIVPRSSQSHYQSGYSLVNAALKFKMLAHQLFGLARGKKERWSLAYPWEDGVNTDFLKGLETIFPSLQTGSTRSRQLYIPGDPRLFDFSYAEAADLSKFGLKQSAYLAGFKAVPVGSDPVTQAPLVAAEIYRLQQENKSNHSSLPDRKRVYTIWEEVTCQPKNIWKELSNGVRYWADCREAIRFEVKKYVQRKLIRKFCDHILQQPLGEAFTSHES